ncbi:MAG: CDP-diacylglycerol--serine O-phosphatidyltransferase [Endozoicomonadaceae bacterium]|nr:CDP-diacylglycerol--serine O-phosphatidyltransferase [Endozoicomonadaceae bacterium]
MVDQSKKKDDKVVDVALPVDEHIEDVVEDGQQVRRKGVYLLPNLLTTAALFSGFSAVISSMTGAFSAAAIAIFVAMILDGIDGRVARFVNAQSKFGAEYDSLSDMVSFGVAPALLSFSWALQEFNKFGWMVAFIYVACAALRLARFNTQVETTDHRFFTGLPSPSAAALVAGMVWAFSDYGVDGSQVVIAMLAVLVTGLSGILMISNFHYSSFKQLNLNGRVPFFFILVVVLCFAVIFTDPPRVLMMIFLVYACSGPIMAIMNICGIGSKKNDENQQNEL